jgi:hypothetical protein
MKGMEEEAICFLVLDSFISLYTQKKNTNQQIFIEFGNTKHVISGTRSINPVRLVCSLIFQWSLNWLGEKKKV